MNTSTIITWKYIKDIKGDNLGLKRLKHGYKIFNNGEASRLRDNKFLKLQQGKYRFQTKRNKYVKIDAGELVMAAFPMLFEPKKLKITKEFYLLALVLMVISVFNSVMVYYLKID